MTDTVRIKTDELEGRALDWVIGMVAAIPDMSIEYQRSGKPSVVQWSEDGLPGTGTTYFPTRNWSQLGPLIERFDATIFGASFVKPDKTWGRNLIASVGCSHTHDGEPAHGTAHENAGEGHLIAFCRAIAAAHFGDYADVPRELVEGE